MDRSILVRCLPTPESGVFSCTQASSFRLCSFWGRLLRRAIRMLSITPGAAIPPDHQVDCSLLQSRCLFKQIRGNQFGILLTVTLCTGMRKGKVAVALASKQHGGLLIDTSSDILLSVKTNDVVLRALSQKQREIEPRVHTQAEIHGFRSMIHDGKSYIQVAI